VERQDEELAEAQTEIRLKMLEKQMAAMIDRYNYVATTQDWMRFKLTELTELSSEQDD